MTTDWVFALSRLVSGGVEDSNERRLLAEVIVEHVETLERIANQRGEKLRDLVRGAMAESGQRRREVVVHREQQVFAFRVPPYDAAWLGDLWSQTTEPKVFRLRPVDERDRPTAVPVEFTVEDPSVAGEPGDVVVTLRAKPNGFEEIEVFTQYQPGWVMARFDVVAADGTP